MAAFIAILLFIDLAVIVFYLVFIIFRKPASALERLSSLNKPSHSATIDDIGPEEPSSVMERVQGLLKPLGEVIPKSPREVGRTRKKLLRAGYRGKAAVTIYYGMSLLSFVTVPLVVYITLNLIGTVPNQQQFLFILLGGVIGYLLPGILVQARTKKRQDAIARSLPDALDLMVVCVEAGLGLDQAIMRVAEEFKQLGPEISEEFGLVNLEMRAGKARVDALRNLASRTSVDDVSSLVAMLIQTDRFGTSIAQSLRVHSDAMRVKRRQRAEEMASKVPVKLVFPIFFFIFPAIFIVTLAPAVLEILSKVWPTLQ